MGATDDARDNPPSLLSDFRLVDTSSAVLEKVRAGHGGAFPDCTHDCTVWSILSLREAATKSMSDPDVGRSTVSSYSRAEATHVSPDNSGNIQSPSNHPFLMKQTTGPLITTVYQRQLPAGRPRIPDSLVACTGHIAETFRRHSNVVIPVGTRT